MQDKSLKRIEKKKNTSIEKEVAKVQVVTFFKVVPLIITGSFFKNLLNNCKDSKKVSSEVTVYENPDYVTLTKTTNLEKKKEINNNVLKQELKKDKVSSKCEDKKEKDTSKVEVEKVKQEKHEEKIVSSKSSNIDNKKTDKRKGKSSKRTKKELLDFQKLEEEKIIEYYESRLKEVRRQLKYLIFDYNVLSDYSADLNRPEEAEVLLQKLNEIIKKIEELKEKIKIEDIGKYDDNYLYHLVDTYIKEFKEHKFVDSIKDSELYILISSKLEELDIEREKLEKDVNGRKEKLDLDFEKMEDIKEEYLAFDNINNFLLKFQNEQEHILQDIKDKVSKSKSIYEKTEYKIKGMSRQTERLLKLYSAYMMIPGVRSGKALATATLLYLYFLKSLMHPKQEMKRYKVVKVKDYHKDIENSTDKLDDVSILLGKTIKQIDNIIISFEKDYKEYLGVLPECSKLLADLKNIKEQISEKEEEIKLIKKEQEKVLEENDQKVKKLVSIEEL